MSWFAGWVQNCRRPERRRVPWLARGPGAFPLREREGSARTPKPSKRAPTEATSGGGFIHSKSLGPKVQDPSGSLASRSIAVVPLQPQVKPRHGFWDIPEGAQVLPGISGASGNRNGSELMLSVKFCGFNSKDVQVSFCCPQTCIMSVSCTVFYLTITSCPVGNKQFV